MAAELQVGELAINWADGRAFTKSPAGEVVTVTLGGASGSGADTVLRALFVPPAPASVTATAGNTQAAISWAAPTVVAQAPITDYVVQYSSNGGTTWTTFSDGTSTATTATVTGLTNGTAYVFRVAAINAVGTGSYSTASSAVTILGLPGAPTGVAATATSGQASVSWTAPTSTGGSAITDYTVQYSSNSGSSWTTFSRAASSATSATVTGLTIGTAYIFQVAAVNSIGTGAYSTASSSVTPATIFSIEYLVVAGGGGAGGIAGDTSYGGGGGGGGILSGNINSGSLSTVSIGQGGGAGQSEAYWEGGGQPVTDGTNGTNSSLGSIIAIGGGGGGGPGNGKNGGSGGGGRGNRFATSSGGSGVSGQGYNGGSQTYFSAGVPTITNRRYGSGGGGAGGVGKGWGPETNYVIAGGPGLSSSITGTARTYSPGGLIWYVANSIATSYGRGGSYVGAYQYFDGKGQLATVYSDLPSDFGVADFRNGSHGVVILAYPSDKPALTLSAGLTYTTSTTSRPGYRVYVITSGSGTISV